MQYEHFVTYNSMYNNWEKKAPTATRADDDIA